MSFSDNKDSFDQCKKITEVTTMWLSQLGQDELSETIGKAVSAFDMMVNACKIVGVVNTLMSAKNASATAEAVAETVPNTVNPAGWGKIALAVGAGVTSFAITSAICSYKLKANLEQPSGLEAVRQFVGNVI